MANYNLVTTGTFQPFTYNELMAPIQEVEKQYDEAETSMSELESKVSLIKDTLPEDSEEYKRATSFLNDLDKSIEDLGSKGVSSALSKKIFNLSRQYNRELVPLAQKTEMLKEAQKTRSQILAKDPNAIFVNELPNIKDISLGETIDNTIIPSASMIEDAYKYALSDVLSAYDGKYDFTQSGIVKNKVIQALKDNYKLDLNDSKYSHLKFQIENAIDSGIIKGVEDRRADYLTTENKGLQYQIYLSKLRTQQAEEMLKPYIYNAETGTYEKNSIVFDENGNFTKLGEQLYNKDKKDEVNKDFHIVVDGKAVVNPIYIKDDGSGELTEIGKEEKIKQGYDKTSKKEEVKAVQKGLFYRELDGGEPQPVDELPSPLIFLDPDKPNLSDDLDSDLVRDLLKYTVPGKNAWYYKGNYWPFNLGEGIYYTDPNMDITSLINN